MWRGKGSFFIQIISFLFFLHSKLCCLWKQLLDVALTMTLTTNAPVPLDMGKPVPGFNWGAHLLQARNQTKPTRQRRTSWIGCYIQVIMIQWKWQKLLFSSAFYKIEYESWQRDQKAWLYPGSSGISFATPLCYLPSCYSWPTRFGISLFFTFTLSSPFIFCPKSFNCNLFNKSFSRSVFQLVRWSPL